MIESEKPTTPILVNLHIKKHNGSPGVELRRLIMDDDNIKSLVTAAFHERPIIIQPVVRDKLKAIGSLADVGLIYRKEGEFYFTF